MQGKASRKFELVIKIKRSGRITIRRRRGKQRAKGRAKEGERKSVIAKFKRKSKQTI